METKLQETGAQSAGAQNINIDINSADETDGKPKSMSLEASSTRNRAGLSKDELMKYANQPFWVRLRNILFASFWILWLTILVVAVGYVVNSPKCYVSAANVTASAIAAGSPTTTLAPGGSS